MTIAYFLFLILIFVVVLVEVMDAFTVYCMCSVSLISYHSVLQLSDILPLILQESQYYRVDITAIPKAVENNNYNNNNANNNHQLCKVYTIHNNVTGVEIEGRMDGW